MRNSVIIIISLITSVVLFTSCTEDALMTNTLEIEEVNVSASEMDMKESNMRILESNTSSEGTTSIFVVDCDTQLRTQTQGGWGSVPRGNNPGAYLHSNFAKVFPKGLTIGSINKITFTNAQAITDFLPVGGTASIITESYENPTEEMSVLVGQLLAATLSVNFDIKDSSFGIARTALRDMRVASGKFKGWTVLGILKESNIVLSGESTLFSVVEINEVLTSINENYIDGVINNGFFECETITDEGIEHHEEYQNP